MNYFGLFFTFMLPGLVLGAMAAAVFQAERQKRAKRAQRCDMKKQFPRRDKLFVYNLMEDSGKNAA